MITGKNIDDALKKEHFENIKFFFEKNSSKNERVIYIKKIYGEGGWGVPRRGDFVDMMFYTATGIEFAKRSGTNTEKIQLSWTKVVERIEKIIESESQISLF